MRKLKLEELQAPDRATSNSKTTLWREPKDEVLTLGEMLLDVNRMAEFLREIPWSGENYRANLRMVRGAARRIIERSTRLIGDADVEKVDRCLPAPERTAE